LVDLLYHRTHCQPDQTAYTFLVDGENDAQHLSYQQLYQRAQGIAAHLKSVAKPGDRALLLHPPGLEFISALFGCLSAGLVAVPIFPPRLNKPDLRIDAVVRDAQATLALTTDDVSRSLGERMVNAPTLSTLQWVSTDLCNADHISCQCSSTLTQEALAILQYTSGSTGSPKGVMLTHGNVLHNLAAIQQAFGHTPASQGVIWLPPYHDMGLIGGILQPLFVGFPVTLMAPTAFLEKPVRWLQAISRYRATTSGGPNFAYELCANAISPEDRMTLDLSSWEVAFNGSEPVRLNTLEKFARTFATQGFKTSAYKPCYGLAEATLLVSATQSEQSLTTLAVSSSQLEQGIVAAGGSAADDARDLLGSGFVAGDQRIVIVDPHSHTQCNPDRLGEIWISGPSVAKGYWNKPEVNRDTFAAHLHGTGEGPFLRTGDMGVMMNGQLIVAGRLKDLIIIRGRNYFPQDIEQTVEICHPALRLGGCAAFAIEHEGEERLVVIQELRRPNPALPFEEIIRDIRAEVAQEHGLFAFDVILTKPGGVFKTSSGKVQRSLCKSHYRAGGFSTGSLACGRSLDESSWQPSSGPGEMVLMSKADLVAIKPAQRKGVLMDHLCTQLSKQVRQQLRGIETSRSLVSLGLDSLMATFLRNHLEREFGMCIPIATLLGEMSLADLINQMLVKVESAATKEGDLVGFVSTLSDEDVKMLLRTMHS
jgi:acyl-CoA synthetase (AMP-forming)/AMP-acid ligase II/acyl carrier protein